MRSSFAAALRFTLLWEGGYVSDPHDPGGGTKYGISDGRDGIFDGLTDVDGDRRPDTAIRDLTLDDAREIYLRDYWLPAGCDDLPTPLDVALFDTGVNCGVRRARGWLSVAGMWRGLLDRRDKHYADLAFVKPARYARFARGWAARVNALRELCAHLETPGGTP